MSDSIGTDMKSAAIQPLTGFDVPFVQAIRRMIDYAVTHPHTSRFEYFDKAAVKAEPSVYRAALKHAVSYLGIDGATVMTDAVGHQRVILMASGTADEIFIPASILGNHLSKEQKEKRDMMMESLNHGLVPEAVVEHTANGRHLCGWSWGSEHYLADYYLCLTYAVTQEAIAEGVDLNEDGLLAGEVFRRNRVSPSPLIIAEMNKLMDEKEAAA